MCNFVSLRSSHIGTGSIENGTLPKSPLLLFPFRRFNRLPVNVHASFLSNRQMYPALMDAAMSEPLNATDVAASVSSVRELVGVPPNPRL